MKLLLTCLSLFCITQLHSQTITINGKAGNRPLNWSDFSGKADKGSPYFAFTFYKIGYRFTNVSFKGDTAILQGLEVNLDFDHNKSWSKADKQSPELLKHEQGHFDIGRLTVAEIMNTINSTVFLKNDFQPKMRAIVTAITKKYNDIGIRYDTETNHSVNKEQQEKWNAWLAAEEARIIK